ncbi:MAG TPA: hypothetical protein VN611_16860 [Patescibacteria group bacterium]|nr:hypothetical protein [Patescibacteria group bacterium]
MFQIRTMLLGVLLLAVSAAPAWAAHGDDVNASVHATISAVLKSGPEHQWYSVSSTEKAPDGVVLDVGETAAFVKQPAANVINIPLQDLHDRFGDLDKSKKIYVNYTPGEAGIKAAYAVAILQIHGFDAWLVTTEAPHAGKPVPGHGQSGAANVPDCCKNKH